MLQRKTILSVVAVVLAVAALASAQPQEHEPRPWGNGGPGGPMHRFRHAEPLSDEQKQELLEALQQYMPQRYERLMELRERRPRAYEVVLRGHWAWYQRWQGLPEDVRHAYITMEMERSCARQLARQIRDCEEADRREQLMTELARSVAQHFDAAQQYQAYRLEQFRRRLAQVEAEIEDRSARRDEIIDEQIEALLAGDCNAMDPGDHPPHDGPPPPHAPPEGPAGGPPPPPRIGDE